MKISYREINSNGKQLKFFVEIDIMTYIFWQLYIYFLSQNGHRTFGRRVWKRSLRGVKVHINMYMRRHMFGGGDQHLCVMYAYHVCTKKAIHALPLKQTWTSALLKMHAANPNAGAPPLVPMSPIICLFHVSIFLRQKPGISVAGVGGWGPARVGIVFSFLPN